MFEVSHLVSNLQFVDAPRPYPIQEYIRARDEYVSSVSRIPGVSAVYQMGGMSCPGISDIDLIVVFRDDVGRVRGEALSARRFGATAQYMFMHPGAMVVSESTFRRLPLLIYAANLQRLSGQDVRRIALPRASVVHVATAIVIDHGVHLLNSLLRYLVAKRVFVRRALMSLGAIRHTLVMARRAGLEGASSWSSLVDEVEDVRKTWLRRQNRPQLVSLLTRGISVLVDVLRDVAVTLRESGVVSMSAGGQDGARLVFFSHNAGALFLDDFERVYSEGVEVLGVRGHLWKVGSRYISNALSVCAAPAELYLHFLTYTRGRSWLSTGLRRIIEDGMPLEHVERTVSAEYAEIMCARVDLWASSLAFLAQRRLLQYDVMPFPGVRRVPIPRESFGRIVRRAVEEQYLLRRNMKSYEMSVTESVSRKGVCVTGAGMARTTRG